MGSDYAFSTPDALTYAQAAAMPAQWSSVPGLDDAARAALIDGRHRRQALGFGGDKECAGRGG